MTKTSIQTVIHERVDPVLEVMISGLVESASRPQTSAQRGSAVTEALALALVEAVMTPPTSRFPKTRVTPLETFLTSVLAAALAPAIAQSLAPTIIQALATRVSTEKPGQEKAGQEAASGKGSDQQEHHQ